MDDNRKKALSAALGQIEKQFGKGSVMRLGDSIAIARHRRGLDRLARPRHRARHRRLAARPRRRDLRAGVVGQDHAHAAGRRRGAEARRHRGVRRRRARARSRLRRARSASTSTICWSRSPTPASRRSRSPTCSCARARWTSIVVDSVAALTPKAEIEGEMGDSHVGLQARLMSQALRKLTGNIKRSNTPRDLHQPDPHEDRRDVRQPRDHDRRQRAEVLRLGAARHPPHRRDQEGRRGHRQRDAREGREEQGRAAVPAGRVRDPLRPRHLARRRDRRPRRQAEHHREVRRLVQLQRRAHRPGQGERARVPDSNTRTSRPRSKSGSARSCCRRRARWRCRSRRRMRRSRPRVPSPRRSARAR